MNGTQSAGLLISVKLRRLFHQIAPWCKLQWRENCRESQTMWSLFLLEDDENRPTFYYNLPTDQLQTGV